MGLVDVAYLANNIIRNKKSGHDIGDKIWLRDYEADGKISNYAMAFSLEFIKRSYDHSIVPLIYARNLAISLIQGVP